jgi:hypothetical protein
MNNQPHLSCVWSAPHDWDALRPNIDVPDEPGYYAFTDHAGPLHPSTPNSQVLYVGIATQSIRERIRKYKTGDRSGTLGLMNMHAGGFFLMLSRATAHYDGKKVTHSVQRTPVQVVYKPTSTTPGHASVLQPDAIYLRWAVDYRAAIEALLIQQLHPKFNTMLVQD